MPVMESGGRFLYLGPWSDRWLMAPRRGARPTEGRFAGSPRARPVGDKERGVGNGLVGPIFDLRYDTRIKPLTLHLRGTNFQLKVWEALLQIPAGAATTYEGLAQRVGRPGASRAVGSAVGHNPIAVLIPCHRVIRKVGDFGNYRYGALRKRALLVREYAAVPVVE